MENETALIFPSEEVAGQISHPNPPLLQGNAKFFFLTCVTSSPKEINDQRQMVWVIHAEGNICTLRPPVTSFHWGRKCILCPTKISYQGHSPMWGWNAVRDVSHLTGLIILASRPDKGKLIKKSWEICQALTESQQWRHRLSPDGFQCCSGTF